MTVIDVRHEAPALLWRSIVQGFGLEMGITLGTIFLWAATAILLVVTNHQAPSVPQF